MAKKRQEPKAPVEDDEGLDIFDEWEEGEEAKAASADDPLPDLLEDEPEQLMPPPPPPKRAAKEPAKSPAKPPAAMADAPTKIDPIAVASDVPVQLIAVLAKKNISMRELMDFHLGSIIDLNRPTSSTVDLVANGRLIARGELVEIDGKLGVRIIKLVK